MIDVTDVRIHKPQGNIPVKAFVSVTINDAIAIHGLRILEGESGLFISFPDKRGKDGKWHDVVHPINTEARAKIQDAVLNAFIE